MSGKIMAGGLVLFTIIFGVLLWYAQYYAYYNEVSGLEMVTVEGRDVAVQDYLGLEGESSGLKLRGCFTVDVAAFDGVTLAENPTPTTPPGWFDCFDVVQLTADVESGAATTYMAAKNGQDGLDRIIAVYPDGRAFMWRQLNDKYQE
ncbi:MAG TPA: histidine kinase [Rhodobacteraceae bacterium]|nr:histidine kinase [Paracoccaceae bacterium]